MRINKQNFFFSCYKKIIWGSVFKICFKYYSLNTVLNMHNRKKKDVLSYVKSLIVNQNFIRIREPELLRCCTIKDNQEGGSPVRYRWQTRLLSAELCKTVFSKASIFVPFISRNTFLLFKNEIFLEKIYPTKNLSISAY